MSIIAAHSYTYNADSIVFVSNSLNLTLDRKDFKIKDQANGIEIAIVNSGILKQLKDITNPKIKLYLNNKEVIYAVGNDILSSSVPKNATYFYPLSEEKKIIFFKDNIIVISKV